MIEATPESLYYLVKLCDGFFIILQIIKEMIKLVSFSTDLSLELRNDGFGHIFVSDNFSRKNSVCQVSNLKF